MSSEDIPLQPLLSSKENITLPNNDTENNRRNTSYDEEEVRIIYGRGKDIWKKYFEEINIDNLQFLSFKQNNVTLKQIEQINLAFPEKCLVVLQNINRPNIKQQAASVKQLIHELKNKCGLNEKIEEFNINLHGKSSIVRVKMEDVLEGKYSNGEVIIYHKKSDFLCKIFFMEHLKNALISTFEENIEYLILLNQEKTTPLEKQKFMEMISSIKNNKYNFFVLEGEILNGDVTTEPSTSNFTPGVNTDIEVVFILNEENGNLKAKDMNDFISGMKKNCEYCLYINNEKSNKIETNIVEMLQNTIYNIKRKIHSTKNEGEMNIIFIQKILEQRNLLDVFNQNQGIILVMSDENENNQNVNYFTIEIKNSKKEARILIKRKNNDVMQAKLAVNDRNIFIINNLNTDCDDLAALIYDINHENLIRYENDESITINTRNLIQNSNSSNEMHNLYKLTCQQWSTNYLSNVGIRAFVDVKWKLLNYLFYYHLVWASMEWTLYINYMVPNLYLLFFVCSIISSCALFFNYNKNECNNLYKLIACTLSGIIFLFLFILYAVFYYWQGSNEAFQDSMYKSYKRVIGCAVIISTFLNLLFDISFDVIGYNKENNLRNKKMKFCRRVIYYFVRILSIFAIYEMPIYTKIDEKSNFWKMTQCFVILISTYALSTVLAIHPTFSCNHEILKKVSIRYFKIMINYLLPVFSITICIFIIYYDKNFISSQLKEGSYNNMSSKTNIFIWSFTNMFIKSVDLNMEDEDLSFDLSLYTIFNLIILITFIVFVVILVTNLLTSMAVNDSNEILKNAEAISCKQLIKYIYKWELLVEILRSTKKVNIKVNIKINAFEMNLIKKDRKKYEDIIYIFKAQQGNVQLDEKLSIQLINYKNLTFKDTKNS